MSWNISDVYSVLSFSRSFSNEPTNSTHKGIKIFVKTKIQLVF